MNSSGQTVDQIYSVNPVTSASTPYAGNVIPGFASQACPWTTSSTSGPANIAAGLLEYIPCPNLPGDYAKLSLRNFDHQRQRRPEYTRESHDRRRACRRRPARWRRTPSRQQPDVWFSLPRVEREHYESVSERRRHHWRAQLRCADCVGAQHRETDQQFALRFQSQPHARPRTSTRFTDDIASALGITGVSTNPFDWGLPNLSFGDLTSLVGYESRARCETRPTRSRIMWCGRTASTPGGGAEISGECSSIRKPAATRAGRLHFLASILPTIVNGSQVMGTGYDFADFLLGLPPVDRGRVRSKTTTTSTATTGTYMCRTSGRCAGI